MKKAILMNINTIEALDILDYGVTVLFRKKLPKNYVGDIYCYVSKKIYVGWCNLFRETIPFKIEISNQKVIESHVKGLYVLKFDNFEVFDEPMQLNEFYIVNKDVREVGAFGHLFNEEELPNYVKLSKPPRNYQYVYVKENNNG